MAKFRVKTRLKFEQTDPANPYGRIREEGEIVELSAKDAAAIGNDLLEPVEGKEK